MPSTRRMNRAVRELRRLRHRRNPHVFDQKAHKRKLRLFREYRRLKTLESMPVPTKAEGKKA